MARLRDTTATSAGGIVVRYEGGVPQLVVGMRRRDHGGTWTLPKGTPNAGESRQETAVREVGEETGLDVRIVAELPSIQYTFVQRGVRVHKTVHYFLMVPTGGDLARHDHEFATVRWIDFADAPALLTFETERALVAQVALRLESGALRVSAADADPTLAPGAPSSEPARP